MRIDFWMERTKEDAGFAPGSPIERARPHVLVHPEAQIRQCIDHQAAQLHPQLNGTFAEAWASLGVTDPYAEDSLRAMAIDILEQADKQDALRQAAGLPPLNRPWAVLPATLAHTQAHNPGYEQLMEQVLQDHSLLGTSDPALPAPAKDWAGWSSGEQAAAFDGVGPQHLADATHEPEFAGESCHDPLQDALEPAHSCGVQAMPHTLQRISNEDLFSQAVGSSASQGDAYFMPHSELGFNDPLSWQENLQQYYQSLG